MSTTIRRALCALALASSGCSSPGFDHLAYRNISDAPGVARLGARQIQIEKGIAVKAGILAVADDGSLMGSLDLQSSDSQVFRVDPGPKEADFVFSGVDVGTADLEVWSEHDQVGTIPVEVLPQK